MSYALGLSMAWAVEPSRKERRGPKRRPAQSSCENPARHARAEAGESGTCFQEAPSLSDCLRKTGDMGAKICPKFQICQNLNTIATSWNPSSTWTQLPFSVGTSCQTIVPYPDFNVWTPAARRSPRCDTNQRLHRKEQLSRGAPLRGRAPDPRTEAGQVEALSPVLRSGLHSASCGRGRTDGAPRPTPGGHCPSSMLRPDGTAREHAPGLSVPQGQAGAGPFLCGQHTEAQRVCGLTAVLECHASSLQSPHENQLGE